MRHTHFSKNIKRSLAILAASTMLMSMPVAAYGGDFSFKLTINSDNDNAQSNYAYRDEGLMGDVAYVTVLKQSNANNNLKFKALKYDSYSNTVSGTATSEMTYLTKYFKSNLPLSYKSTYVSKDGAYKLYGRCAKNTCSASGNWRP